MAEEYHVQNFGCRASQADGDAIDAELCARGLTPTPHAAGAALVIVNTCSVTAQADRRARAYVRRVRRENPAAKILVTGCYAQRAPQEVAALEGVHAVVGNSHKHQVAELAASSLVSIAMPAKENAGRLDRASADINPDIDRGITPNIDRRDEWAGPLVRVGREFSAPTSPFAHWDPSREAAGVARALTRPNLKVQDGCGNRCAFCVIPLTRGASRSMDLDECLRSVDAFVGGGGQELVLSGINLGQWGRDLTPRRGFEDLVAAILSRTALPRLRLSSVEPMDWTTGLLSLFQEYSSQPPFRLARHAHLPLQSGSDAILRAMHRRYRPWHYREKVIAIRRLMPEAAIGADVMVGFPGESDTDFEESFEFIDALPFTYLHLFPFSPRPETKAWEIHGRSAIAAPVVEERMARLRQSIAAKNLAFRRGFVGRSLSAVTLRASKGGRGFTRAITDNFLDARIAEDLLPNLRIQVHISGVGGDGLLGRRA